MVARAPIEGLTLTAALQGGSDVCKAIKILFFTASNPEECHTVRLTIPYFALVGSTECMDVSRMKAEKLFNKTETDLHSVLPVAVAIISQCICLQQCKHQNHTLYDLEHTTLMGELTRSPAAADAVWMQLF